MPRPAVGGRCEAYPPVVHNPACGGRDPQLAAGAALARGLGDEDRRMGLHRRANPLSRTITEALDLVAPLRCAGCQRAGSRWCTTCQHEVAATVLPNDPLPNTLQTVPTWAFALYRDRLAAAIVQYKDDGRRDLRPVLAPLLAQAARACLLAPGWPERLWVVPIPSSAASRRRRGDDPVAALAHAAMRRCGRAPNSLQWAPVLRFARPVLDQSVLTRRDRAQNVAQSMRVVGHHGASGTAPACLLLDDVCTTGATLAEAGRALRAAGASLVRAAVLAAAPAPGESAASPLLGQPR